MSDKKSCCSLRRILLLFLLLLSCSISSGKIIENSIKTQSDVILGEPSSRVSMDIFNGNFSKFKAIFRTIIYILFDFMCVILCPREWKTHSPLKSAKLVH